MYKYSEWARAFVSVRPLKPSLMFVGEARSLTKWSTFQLLHTKVGSSLTANIILGLKGLLRSNALAYYENLKIMAAKRFMTLSSGINHKH
jgi:hypothetical protein